MDWETEYTFRNTATDLLNDKGRTVIDTALKELRCKQCGLSLFRVTYQEGDVIYCKSSKIGGGWHHTGYDIDIWNNPPKVVEEELSDG